MSPAEWLEQRFELIWSKYGRVHISHRRGLKYFTISTMWIPGMPENYRRPGAFMSIKEDLEWELISTDESHTLNGSLCASV